MQPQTLEMISRLVSFNTVSSRSNLDLMVFVETWLESHGVAFHKIFSPCGEKANLYATIGPMVEGGVVLSGHTDVVPVEGQDWSTDPFTLVEKDGRLYGRGTCDMKGFVALALAAVPDMVKADLKRPIHLALSYDEEVGCTGVSSMVEAMAETLPKPSAVIVGEPSMMGIVNAHKGIEAYRTRVTGRAAHSSQTDRGVSAVMMASRLITFLDDLAEECRSNAPEDCPFEPPFTTIHCGVVNGGTALNIISEQCEFLWDMRTIPSDDAAVLYDRFEEECARLRTRMQAVAPETDIITESLADAPALGPETESEAERLCASVTGRNSTGVVSYATEAGHFQRVGFSTAVCGPGSIDQAHQADEFITLEQVREGEAFMHKLIRSLEG